MSAKKMQINLPRWLVKIYEWPFKVKCTLLLISLLLTGFFIVVLLIAPAERVLGQLKTQQRQYQQQYLAQRRQYVNQQQLLKQQIFLTTRYGMLLNSFNKPVPSSLLLSQLVKIIKMEGFELQSIKPLPSQMLMGYIKQPINLNIVGSDTHLMTLFLLLTKQPWLFQIIAWQVKLISHHINVQLAIEVYHH